MKAADSIDQRLRSLGLSEAEVTEFKNLVPTVRAILSEKRPTLTLQREALDDLGKAVSDMKRAATRVVKLTDSEGLGISLLERIGKAGWGSGEVFRTFNELLDLLEDIQPLVNSARDQAKAAATQSRNRVRTLPIKLVHRALPRIQPSANESSQFRAVIEALYDAAGYGETNPERAIREFVSLTSVKDGSP